MSWQAHKVLCVSFGWRECNILVTFFNFEINRLTDRFIVEIEENVNPGTEKRQFSKTAFENRKNMQF